MDINILKQLTDTIDEVTNFDNEELSEQLTPMILTAMMILVIKRNTTKEERETMINASMARFKHNIMRDLDFPSLNKLDEHIDKTKSRLCGMLL